MSGTSLNIVTITNYIIDKTVSNKFRNVNFFRTKFGHLTIGLLRGNRFSIIVRLVFGLRLSKKKILKFIQKFKFIVVKVSYLLIKAK